jgi:DNA-binding transcriptional ArsR family regulator
VERGSRYFPCARFGHMTAAGASTEASQDALHAATELLRALASPVRLGIVRELADGGREVHELAGALGVSQPLVSQHLRVLRTSRLVVGRRHARAVEYSLTDHHIAHIVLDAIRHVQEEPGDEVLEPNGPSAHPGGSRPGPAPYTEAQPATPVATTLDR